jgi:DNA-binding CsgD family transcriptional regulator
MSDTKPHIYLKKLDVIMGVKFTLREIDVISCILTGKIAKSMSSVLGIETRTYETHYSNIKKKLQINTKEQLIDLIETADLRKYYRGHTHLLKVENTLTNLKSQNQLSNQECFLYYKESYNNITFLELLKRHLNLLNIKVRLKPYETSNTKFINTQDFDFCLLLDCSFDENEKKLYLFPLQMMKQTHIRILRLLI